MSRLCFHATNTTFHSHTHTHTLVYVLTAQRKRMSRQCFHQTNTAFCEHIHSLTHSLTHSHLRLFSRLTAQRCGCWGIGPRGFCGSGTPSSPSIYNDAPGDGHAHGWWLPVPRAHHVAAGNIGAPGQWWHGHGSVASAVHDRPSRRAHRSGPHSTEHAGPAAVIRNAVADGVANGFFGWWCVIVLRGVVGCTERVDDDGAATPNGVGHSTRWKSHGAGLHYGQQSSQFQSSPSLAERGLETSRQCAGRGCGARFAARADGAAW